MEEDEKLEVWGRVDRELTRRKGQHMRPGSWTELGATLNASKQSIHNWKTRGLPKLLYPDVAAQLGWTVDQLLGIAEAQRPTASAVVSEHQRLFQALSEQQQEDVHAYLVRVLMNVTPGVADKVTRNRPGRGQHIGGMDTNFGDLPEEDQKKASGGKR